VNITVTVGENVQVVEKRNVQHIDLWACAIIVTIGTYFTQDFTALYIFYVFTCIILLFKDIGTRTSK